MCAQHNHVRNLPASSVASAFIDEISKASEKGRAQFFNWFDEAAGDADSTFVKGHCEFGFYVLLPLIDRLHDTMNKIVLEIGYGGGRLLAAAAPLFKQVIGIDIHESATFVSDELKKRGIDNFELLRCNGADIPVQNNSVDLVYSFIVFQHLVRVSTFTGYLAETWRVLKDGGYAVLFFGRLSILSRDTRSKALYILDRCIENLSLKGFREMSAPINATNLRVSLPYAVRQARRLGFIVIHRGVSRKLPQVNTYGGQSFLVLRK